jgi:acyl-CoA hydrolase
MQSNVNGLATLPNHQLAMTLLMTPDMGNVHGGTILKLLDQVAYACASRYAGRYVVTLSVSESQSTSASSLPFSPPSTTLATPR